MGKKTVKKKTEKKPGKKTEKPTSKPMSKKLRFIIPLIVIICVIGAVFFTLNPEIISAEEAKAELANISGTVEVKKEGGSWTTAENGTLLYQSDSVKTGNDSSASILLFKSSLIRLDSNTEVTIKKILEEEETSVKMQQDSGRTWNTISKISGIDNYEVETPSTIASARGTAFDVNLLSNGTTNVSVVNGTVNVSRTENGTIVDTIEVKENESVTIDPNRKGKPLGTKPLKKDEWVEENEELDEENLEKEKEELYERLEPYMSDLKDTYGMTDQELEVLIDGYIRGYDPLPSGTPSWIRELFEPS